MLLNDNWRLLPIIAVAGSGFSPQLQKTPLVDPGSIAVGQILPAKQYEFLVTSPSAPKLY